MPGIVCIWSVPQISSAENMVPSCGAGKGHRNFRRGSHTGEGGLQGVSLAEYRDILFVFQ